MALSDSFKDFLSEQFSPIGGVGIRKMFGGAGVSYQGLSIGLADDDVLYLKVDEVTAAAYDAEGMEPFSYPMKDGKVSTMRGYRRCPDRLYDDPEEFERWARAAIEAAMRAAKAKPKPKPKTNKAR